MAIPLRAQNSAANKYWFWIALVFLTSRIFILSFPSIASDVGIYATYAREQIAADRAGVSFYAYHARLMEQAAENRLIRPAARYVGPLPPVEVADP